MPGRGEELATVAHDAFGGLNKSADLSRLMKDLIELKQRART